MNIEDSILLACPREHIEAGLEMCRRQPEPIRFTGGFESRFVTPWFVSQLKTIRLARLYLAFDRPGEKKLLLRALSYLKEGGIHRGQIRCFTLVAFGKDTPEKAEERLQWCFRVGATPFAMYYRPPTLRKWGPPAGEWKELVTNWTWDRVIYSRMKRLGVESCY